MTYKLMIKIHNKTKLKYLCVTKRDDWEKYTGSGKYWLNHLKKYGEDISTELLYESDDYEDFGIKCLYYSELYDVVLSEEFANLIPETGYDDSIVPGMSNFELWWKHATDEMKKIVIEKRSLNIKKNHWAYSDKSDETRNKISIASIKKWDKLSLDERREVTNHMRSFVCNFFEDKESERYKIYVENARIRTKSAMDATPKEVLSERNRQQRLNTPPDVKERRKKKIQEVYKTGKHDHLFEKMSEDRKGVDNPMAKITVWYGKEYSMKDFKRFMSDNNLDEEYVDTILRDSNIIDCYRKFDIDEKKVYDILVCPHCGKIKGSDKHHSSFMRWHFDNCRKKR